MAWRGLEILRLLEGGPKLTRELISSLGMTRDGVRDTCARLERRGLLARAEGIYQITEAGKQAVSGGADIVSGSGLGGCAERYKSSIRSRAWRALRIRRKAGLDELLPLLLEPGASTEDEQRTGRYLARYLDALAKAGFLHALPRRGGPARWLLVRDTGPCAPAWNKARGTVADTNTGEVHRV